jgi:UDP-N-acetylglucosamine 4,6-dehydratase
VIQPTIQFSDIADFTTNRLGERGVPVAQGFEYNSGNNSEWLTHAELLEMAKEYL